VYSNCRVIIVSEFFSETKERLKLKERLEFNTTIPKLSSDSTFAKESEIDVGESAAVRMGDKGVRGGVQQESAAEADFTCLTCRVPRSTIKKILIEKGMIDKIKTTLDDFETVEDITSDNYLKKYDFYQTMVNLSVEFEDPTRHSLIYSRFSLLLESEAAQILKIAPDEKGIGIVTKVKETGGTKVGVSPTLEMGISVEQEQKSEKTNSESSTKFNFGPKIGVEGSWSREKGFEITYDNLIEKVKGTIQNENKKVTWEVYQTKLKQPEGNLLGKMVSVPAFLIFWVKKLKEKDALISQTITAKINAEGKVKEIVPRWFDTEKTIKFVGKRQIELGEIS
jgi:hypothetical protein